MSMNAFSKKTYHFAEVIPLQENVTGVRHLFNKIRLVGVTRRIRVAGDVRVYEFTKANDKTQTASITDVRTPFINPDADRDWDDDTSAYISPTPPGLEEYDVRIYDYGESKWRFLCYKFSAYSIVTEYEGTGRLYYSSDGTNWTMLKEVTNGTVSGVTLQTFRYLKFTLRTNDQTATPAIWIYSVEVFDPGDYTKKTVCTKYAEHEISTHLEPVQILLRGSLYSYYVYDLNPVKVTVSEGEVEI